MEEWNMGIFSIMAMMTTIIGIIIATRFIYIDNHYSRIINERQIFLEDVESKIDSQLSKNDGGENVIKNDYEIVNQGLLKYYKDIGFYEAKRNDNKKEGMIIDFLSLFCIVVLGLLSTVGFFKDIFVFLIIILIPCFVAPLIHFMVHIRTIQKKSEL